MRLVQIKKILSPSDLLKLYKHFAIHEHLLCLLYLELKELKLFIPAVMYLLNNPLSTCNIFDAKKRTKKENKIAKSIEENKYVHITILREKYSKYKGEDNITTCKKSDWKL